MALSAILGRGLWCAGPGSPECLAVTDHSTTDASRLVPSAAPDRSHAAEPNVPADSADVHESDGDIGLAHVAALAFVAARAVPGLGFPVAAGGGIAISRTAERSGLRRGVGAAVAAIVEAIAILGPARLGAPLGQTVTAPAIGGIARRGGGFTAQLVACNAIRLAFNIVGTAFFIWVIAGGVETYSGAYDSVLGRIPGVPTGVGAALVITAVGIVLWSLGASAVQVWAYRRASTRWSEGASLDEAASRETASPGTGSGAGSAVADIDGGAPTARPGEGRDRLWSMFNMEGASESRRRPFDPRAVTAAAAVAFALLLISTEWALLGAVVVWLAVAWLVAPADREVVPAGVALAAVLAIGAFVANMLGGEGLSGSLAHAVRAALLVLVATWMRGAAGAEGFKEVARRVLGRLRRLPAMPEAVETLDQLGSERRLGDAARSLTERVKVADQQLLALFDAVLAWIAAEAERFQAALPPAPPRLAYRPFDAALLTIVAVPALAFGLPAA